MNKVQFLVNVDRNAAIRAGRAEYGPALVTIDPGVLTPEERELLVAVPSSTYTGRAVPELTHSEAGPGYRPVDMPPVAFVDPDGAGGYTLALDVLRELLYARAAAKQTHVEAKQREEAEQRARHEARVQEWLEKQPEQCVEDRQYGSDPWRVVSMGSYETAMPDDPRLANLRAAATHLAAERNQAHAAKRAAEREAAERTKREHEAAEAATVRAWVEAHGDANQQARYRAGKLPVDEALAGMREEEFLPAAGFPRYQRLTAVDACRCEYGERCQVEFGVDDLEVATAAQWDRIVEIQQALPEATLTLREHTATATGCGGSATRFSIKAEVYVFPFRFTREYAVPADPTADTGDEDE